MTRNIKFKSVSILFLIIFCFLTYNVSYADVSSPQPNDPTAKTSDSWFTNLFSPTKTPTVDNSQPTPVPSSSLIPNQGLTPTKTPTSGNTTYTTNSSLGGDAVSPTYTSTSGGSSCTATAKDFKGLISNLIKCILVPLGFVLLSLAIFIFVFGVFKIIASNSVEDKEKGRDFIFWGIIGIFVMVSLWGLVSVLQHTFILNTNSINVKTVTIPSF